MISCQHLYLCWYEHVCLSEHPLLRLALPSLLAVPSAPPVPLAIDYCCHLILFTGEAQGAGWAVAKHQGDKAKKGHPSFPP